MSRNLKHCCCKPAATKVTLANENCGNVNQCRDEDNRPENPTFFNARVNPGCVRGMCYAPVSPTAPYFPTPVWSDPAQEVNAAVFGQYTGAAPIPGLVQQPRYWVEVLAVSTDGTANSFNRVYYRITVRATGRNNGTVVYLQSIYDPFVLGS